jgi:anti-sigma factor RsiW
MSAGFQIASLRAWFLQRRFRPMNCVAARELLPGYLDGALPERSAEKMHARLGRHLDECLACRMELQRYRALSRMLANAGPAAPPADLGVAIRSAVSRARANSGFSGRRRRLKTRLELVLGNILEPLALPAGGGLVAALVVFGIVYQVLGVGMPRGAARTDSPTNLLQPARLETLAGFETASLSQADRAGEQHGLLVEATVNAQGQAVDYRVISGQVDAAMLRQLDQVVLFSRFRPQLNFGRPTSGGRVVLSFSQIRVRG